MLSTRSSLQDFINDKSQPVTIPQVYQIDIEDPRLHKIQAHDVKDHFKKATSNKRKKKVSTYTHTQASSTEERAALIDQNMMLLVENMKAFNRVSNYKRKAQLTEEGRYRKRKITYGK